MRVWAVMDGDYDSTWIVAVYTDEAMATEHASEMGLSTSEHEIAEVLPDEVTSPIAKQKRADAIEQSRREYAERKQQQVLDAARRADVKPWGDKIPLCQCQVYQKAEDKVSHSFINAHGYCAYCGGFTIAAYRAHLGDDALRAKIDEFDLHSRTILRQKAGL